MITYITDKKQLVITVHLQYKRGFVFKRHFCSKTTVHHKSTNHYGAKDEKVSREEIDQIFNNLIGQKKLKIYQEAGHENYLTKYKNEWKQDIHEFFRTE